MLRTPPAAPTDTAAVLQGRQESMAKKGLRFVAQQGIPLSGRDVGESGECLDRHVPSLAGQQAEQKLLLRNGRTQTDRKLHALIAQNFK